MKFDLRYRQDKDYNCGPYALAMFLDLHGYDEDGRELEDILKPSKKRGTPACRIEDFLNACKIPFKRTNTRSTWKDIVVPSLVLYKPGKNETEHYGVIVAKTDDYIVIAEPWFAQTHRVTKEKFLKQWKGYSAAKWSVSLVAAKKDAKPIYEAAF